MNHLNLNIDHPEQMQAWDSFVENHPHGTPFHSSPWLNCLQKTYRYKGGVQVLKDEKEQICAGFPYLSIPGLSKKKRIVSLPFSDYGGILSNAEDIEGRFLDKLVNKRNHVEIRGLLKNKARFKVHDYFKKHVLALNKDPEKIKERLNKKTIQYNIRRAVKNNIKIIEANSEFGIEEFHRLNKLTRKKHGVPGQPKKFLQNIYKELITKNKADILLAMHSNKAIAAGLFIKFQNTVYYKYNASNPEFIKKYAPNHLLTWHAIEQACLAGYKQFDFGRTSPDNTGLMRYKAMWGAQEFDLPYYYYPELSGVASIEEKSKFYNFMTKIWRVMPDGLAEIVGSRIYRYFG